MPNIVSRTVSLSGRQISYLLERKNVRNINLRIRPDGSVRVSAHPQVPAARVDAFVASKSAFVLQAQERIAQRQARQAQPPQYADGDTIRLLGRDVPLQVCRAGKERVEETADRVILHVKDPDDHGRKERLMARFRDEKCREVFTRISRDTLPAFAAMGVEEPALRIRSMTSRWGSCMARKGLITLNKRLLEAPLPCIEYVVLHEYCHFIHLDHSRRFYALLESFMPDWKNRRMLLNQDAERWR